MKKLFAIMMMFLAVPAFADGLNEELIAGSDKPEKATTLTEWKEKKAAERRAAEQAAAARAAQQQARQQAAAQTVSQQTAQPVAQKQAVSQSASRQQASQRSRAVSQKQPSQSVSSRSDSSALTHSAEADTLAFYVAPRLGYGDTITAGFDNPDARVFGAAFGAHITDAVRVEFEYANNKKAKMEKRAGFKNTYAQDNYALNAYYDFDSDSKLRPFVGAGVGLYRAKVATQENGIKETKTNKNYFASVQAGVSYALTRFVALEAMARYRMLNHGRHNQNLEGLGGVRFSF